MSNKKNSFVVYKNEGLELSIQVYPDQPDLVPTLFVHYTDESIDSLGYADGYILNFGGHREISRRNWE